MNIQRTIDSLTREGFVARYFDTAKEAADYLCKSITGKTVGFGGSVTLEQMGLYEKLAENNTVYWHWKTNNMETRTAAAGAEVYLSSANAIAETGEIVNIDGSGNRVAATLTKHERLYFVVGENKIAPDLHRAIDRARNIASPLNAQRLHRKTPCAVKADRCYDCKSPERICRSLNILWEKPMQIGACELILIREKLGY